MENLNEVDCPVFEQRQAAAAKTVVDSATEIATLSKVVTELATSLETISTLVAQTIDRVDALENRFIQAENEGI